MKILVVCQYYYPEPFRISDICEELVKRGNEVTVVTGSPNYPMGEIYSGYEEGKHQDEIINGVKVHRCSIHPRKTGAIHRLWNYYSYAFASTNYVNKLDDSFDVVFINQLHYISNYGSVLQTYATQRIFENLGLESECVNYIRKNCSGTLNRAKTCLNEINPNANYLHRLLFYMYYYISDIKRKKVFESFIRKNIKLSYRYESYSELISNPPCADIYCTGSDQTWNSEYNGGVLPEYFLGYVPAGRKKISFSASFGMDYIPVNDVEEIKSLLNSYECLSVRETSAKALLSKLG